MSTRWDTTCAIFFSLPMEFHCHYEKTTAWNLICNPFANSMKRWIFRSYLAKCLSRCHMMSLDKNGKRLPFNVPFYPELFYLLLFAFITAHGRSSLLRTIRINSQSTIWITQDCFLLDFQSVARRTRISTYIMDMKRVNKKCGGETFSDLHLRWIKKTRCFCVLLRLPIIFVSFEVESKWKQIRLFLSSWVLVPGQKPMCTSTMKGVAISFNMIIIKPNIVFHCFSAKFDHKCTLNT